MFFFFKQKTAYEIEQITQLIASIRARGVTIVLVEHVQAVVRALAERVVVLDWGRKIAEGTPSQIAKNSDVIKVYFGTEQEKPALTEEQIPAPKQAVSSSPLLSTRQLSVDYGKLRA